MVCRHQRIDRGRHWGDVYRASSYEETWNFKWHGIMLEKGREDVDVLCTCIYQALLWVDAYCGRNHGVTEGKYQYQLQCQNVLSETLGGQNCKMVSKLCGISMSSRRFIPTPQMAIIAPSSIVLHHAWAPSAITPAPGNTFV
ncbi:hypothetical protein EYC80_004296 [Monilinia laxa]|uniref:Uncharacterized protein n=1 Tax=Monilinia laxa TaxID=61186 RepID=A0A5N6KMY5_MONLA|nr:hypothetical protein EYC80_004296 [Monilinia laxa]